jgi:hypothetical protein
MAAVFGLQRDDKRCGNQIILREFVMKEVSTDSMMNMDMVVERLRPQLEVTKEDIEPIIIMGLYHHRNLIGSQDAFMKGNC